MSDRSDARSAATVERTPAMVMRGTPADAPKIRRLLDEVAVRVPNDELGHALYEWAEEVTRIAEAIPPDYTSYIGRQLLDHLALREEAVA